MQQDTPQIPPSIQVSYPLLARSCVESPRSRCKRQLRRCHVYSLHLATSLIEEGASFQRFCTRLLPELLCLFFFPFYCCWCYFLSSSPSACASFNPTTVSQPLSRRIRIVSGYRPATHPRFPQDPDQANLDLHKIPNSISRYPELGIHHHHHHRFLRRSLPGPKTLGFLSRAAPPIEAESTATGFH